jgi:hypothetical protein
MGIIPFVRDAIASDTCERLAVSAATLILTTPVLGAYLNTTDYRHRIKRIQLMDHLRVDGTRIVHNDTPDTAHPPTPPRDHDFTSRRDQDDGGELGRGGTG